MIEMTKIIVDRKALERKLSQSRRGDLIELRIVEAQADRGAWHPAFLHVAALHGRDSYRDLESIDAYIALPLGVRTA